MCANGQQDISVAGLLKKEPVIHGDTQLIDVGWFFASDTALDFLDPQ